MKRSLIITLLVTLLATLPGTLLADGQFNLAGAAYSLYPGSNSCLEGGMQSGYYTGLPGTDGILMVFANYGQDMSLDTYTMGLGAMYAMPVWKLLVGGGINAFKWDIKDDSLTATDKFGIDATVMWWPNGIADSWFGFAFTSHYVMGIDKLQLGLNLGFKPKAAKKE